MTFKKITGFLHLWLGLLSGLVIFIVAITGCLYAFQAEIQDMIQDYRFVEPQSKQVLPPSAIRPIAEKALPHKKIHSVEYGTSSRAAKAIFFSFDPEYYYVVYINQYSGEVLKVKDMNKDFFRFVIMGHYYLWLPPAVGKPIVASATLIFVVLLITGLVLWWPGSKRAIKQSFTLKWKIGWKRKNYDLHNVLGFYVMWIIVFVALTGLVWGFQWFAKTVYWTTSGGKTFVEYYNALSDTTTTDKSAASFAVDKIWRKTVMANPGAETIEVHFPEDSHASIAVNSNTDASTYWRTDYRYYDQYSLQEIRVKHMYGQYRDDLPAADKIMRMNYDIHVGSILGLPGKFLAFFASLICASLPITGFFIWWNKRKQTRKSLISEL